LEELNCEAGDHEVAMTDGDENKDGVLKILESRTLRKEAKVSRSAILGS